MSTSVAPVLLSEWHKYRAVRVPVMADIPCGDLLLELLEQTYLEGARTGAKLAIHNTAAISRDLHDLRDFLAWLEPQPVP